MSDNTPNQIQSPNSFLLASSPHISSPVNSRRLMANMLMALAPASIFGIVIFGVPALLNIIVSVAAAVLSEFLFRKITGQSFRAGDLSAGVSGLLLALIVPPSTPLWMTALGAIFAVIVAKEFFGGLGANVFNPALAGRAFLLMSFPAALTTWHNPRGGFSLGVDSLSAASAVDGISGVTPLGILKAGGTTAEIGRTFQGWDLSATEGYRDTIGTLFIGNHAGSIGESSILCITAALIFLILTRTIDWRAPLAMLVTGFIASFCFGMDPLVGILSGGLAFGAVFMVTDYVTAPLTAWGKFIFGAGAGLITILIRKWGSYPEGVTYGILIMNALTPFLNRLLPKKYGSVSKPKAKAKEAS
ncbi:MAG: RnfABCDGE type electron transport complex subunit D [Treponema sp.]|jgi:electron transport complex protein RnfD|nr:RnfABCDGE type electron transport complex subunit D [Treponema sp.]